MAKTKVVGLTGGIGSGKSTVARLFAERGAVVVDADLIAREVVAPGTEALREIVAHFGPGVLRPDGSLDRKALAGIVFADEAARAALEAITHPRITAIANARLEAARLSGAPLVVYEGALIVERRLYEGLDALVVVAAEPQAQVARVRERDGLSEADIRARISAQLPLEEKLRVADYVVDNRGSLDDTERQVADIWRELRNGHDEDGEEGEQGR